MGQLLHIADNGVQLLGADLLLTTVVLLTCILHYEGQLSHLSSGKGLPGLKNLSNWLRTIQKQNQKIWSKV